MLSGSQNNRCGAPPSQYLSCTANSAPITGWNNHPSTGVNPSGTFATYTGLFQCDEFDCGTASFDHPCGQGDDWLVTSVESVTLCISMTYNTTNSLSANIKIYK